jgi:hypothetical protein
MSESTSDPEADALASASLNDVFSRRRPGRAGAALAAAFGASLTDSRFEKNPACRVRRIRSRCDRLVKFEVEVG